MHQLIVCVVSRLVSSIDVVLSISVLSAYSLAVCLCLYRVCPCFGSSHQLIELRALAGGSLVLHPSPPLRGHGRGQAIAVELHPAEAAPAGSCLKLNLESHLTTRKPRSTAAAVQRIQLRGIAKIAFPTHQ